MKLKPGVERRNKNDYFNLLVSLTTGGARDQATAQERELIADLAERNAAARRKYERDLAEYDRQMLLWNARTPPKESTFKDKEAEPPKPPADPEKLTEYADPVNKLWKLFEKLYPERSKSRTDEFTQFQLRPNETIASLVQRMQTLKLVLKQSEQAAATRLLAALRPKKLQEEVRRMMISSTDGLDEWTVIQLGEFAIRLDRIASEEALWNATIQADTSASRGAPPTTRGGKTRVCHNCGKPGHIARDCRSKPRAGNAATNMRPANAPANQRPVPRGPCYHCHQMGHVAAECPDCQPGGKLARREHGKPWCEHHRVNSHSTDECRALNNDKPKAEARATHTMDEEPASSHDAPDRPTYNELLEFWESQQAMMAQGYSGTLVARSMANASPCLVTRPNARAASTFHPGLTKRGPENQRIKGRLSNMPLGFLPRDTIGPPRPMPAPAPAPHVPSAGSEPEPIADPPARVTRTCDPSPGSTRPQRSQPVEPVRAEPAMPLGFEELPAHDERYQGQIYGPSKLGPDTVPAEGPDDGHQDADEPAPENPGTAGSNPEPPSETTSPAKKSEPSSIEPEGSDRPVAPVAGTAGDIYDAANPDLAALLSRLSGSYHSDRAQGTYRRPRIDNKGPRPAMVINGQVLS
jgi:hypothetical protein